MPLLDSSVIAPVGAAAVVVSIVTGFFTFRVARLKNRVDYAEFVQRGFKALIDELRKQHEEDQKEIALFRGAVDDLSQKIRDLSNDMAEQEAVLRAHGLWDQTPKTGLIGIPRR